MAALSFNQVKGESSKDKTPSYKMKDGNNKVRVIGGVLARYIYWVPNKGGTNSPVECLAFDRDQEKFTNEKKDWVKEYYPDLKAEWAYASLVLDEEGNIVIFNHKKKLLKAIIDAVEDLGDPSDPATGWDICFTRAKTGPKVYNVEYTLQTLKCSKSVRALTTEELEKVEAHPSIDEVLKRPNPEAIKNYLDEIRSGAPADGGEAVDDEIPDDFSE